MHTAEAQMRKVIITYIDGRKEEYGSIVKASQALGCCKRRIERMGCGLSRRLMSKLGVESVEVKASTGAPRKGLRRAWMGKVPVRCTSELGETFSTGSIREAMELTGARSIAAALDSGEYVNGWKYDSLPAEKGIRFEKAVPDDIMDTIYRFARHYLRRLHFTMGHEDREDMLQDIVCRTAADESCGKYDSKKREYSHEVWLYLRVKHHGFQCVHKWIREDSRKVEPHGDIDKDVWLELVGGHEDSGGTMFQDMPVQHRQLSQLLLAGWTRSEVQARLGVTDAQMRTMMQDLADWVKGYLE